jgi:hypothetical protein
MEELLISIFCDVDDFCKIYEEYHRNHLLGDAKNIIPKSSMSISEIMTIVIFFHLSNHKTFKWYYKNYICETLVEYFPKLVSYNRFVELMRIIIIPLTLYLIKLRFGKCSGISFVDSTTIDVCSNYRIYSHKVFKEFASIGKSSTGWFYGFKLHLIVNDRGDILSFCLTPGNVDDRNWKVLSFMTKEIFGKLFADRGYLSQGLFEKLYRRNIVLITRLKKNMKNKLMVMKDKLLLRKRAIIESINDFLKNICQIEHTRHRSISNFIVNLLSGLVGYSFIPKKPSIHFDYSLEA